MISNSSLESLMINPEQSILEVMRVIDAGAAQVGIWVSENQVLQGIITDGDLRRALLSGAQITDPVGPYISTDFKKVEPSAGRSEALDLMKCFSIKQLPVVNETGQLCGLHLIRELIQPDTLPNSALILAGGRGTRLGEMTKATPKPMLKVAGRPILERIVLHLIGHGIRNIFLSVNYLSEQIERHFGNGADFGCSIYYVHEDEPLGTGGPLRLLPKQAIQSPLIVMNGDLITEFDVNNFLQYHSIQKNNITIGVRNYTHQIPFGCIELDEYDRDKVVSLREKPTYQSLINTGIYAIEGVLIDSIPEGFSPITELISTALKNGNRVGTFPVDDWIDIGLPDQLAAARGQ